MKSFKLKNLNICVVKFEGENFEHLHCWYQSYQKQLFEINEVNIWYQPHRRVDGLMDGRAGLRIAYSNQKYILNGLS